MRPRSLRRLQPSLFLPPGPPKPAKPPLRIAFSDWPGWNGFRGRYPKRVVQRGRRRYRLRVVRIHPVDGGFHGRQGRRRHDDHGRCPGDRSARRPQRRYLDHRLQQWQRHDRCQAGHRQSQRAQGQEGRSRDWLGRAPPLAPRALERGAERDRRQIGQRGDPRDGAISGLERRRRHRGLAAQRWRGTQGSRRCQAGLHQRRRTGPHLRFSSA